MMLKKSALALALGLTLAGAANAAVTHLGTIAAPTNYGHSSFINGEFSDVYTFSIAASTYSSGTVVSSEFTNMWGITGLSVDLYSGLYGDDIPDGTPYTLGGSETAKVGAGTYAAGDYYYVVSGIGNGGTVGGTGLGAYTIGVFAQPVPEPESYAMLLAGLGLMGTIARRRSKGRAS